MTKRESGSSGFKTATDLEDGTSHLFDKRWIAASPFPVRAPLGRFPKMTRERILLGRACPPLLFKESTYFA